MNGRLQFFLSPGIPGCTADLQANDIVAPTQSLYLLCPGDSFNCHQSIEDDLHVEGPQLHCHFCMYQRTDVIWVFELNKLPQSLSTPHFENIGFESPCHALKVQIAAMSSILPAACFSDVTEMPVTSTMKLGCIAISPRSGATSHSTWARIAGRLGVCNGSYARVVPLWMWWFAKLLLSSLLGLGSSRGSRFDIQNLTR